MTESTFHAAPPLQLPVNVPLHTIPLTIGGRTWQITAVLDQDALLEVADELEFIPYGYLLWEAAIGLADFLCRHADWLKGKRVLEQGTGVGLAGLVARGLGAEVWQTDHQPGALLLADYNARQNGINDIQQFLGDWRKWQHDEQYDIILGSDILYERGMHAWLEPIFRRNLAPGGRLIISDPSRPQALEALASMEDLGWRFEMEMQTIPAVQFKKPTPSVEVAVYHIVRL